MSVHKIAGSEILTRHRMLPGYAAMRMGAPRPRHWRWPHTTLLFSLAVVAVVFAQAHGMLP